MVSWLRGAAHIAWVLTAPTSLQRDLDRTTVSLYKTQSGLLQLFFYALKLCASRCLMQDAEVPTWRVAGQNQ